MYRAPGEFLYMSAPIPPIVNTLNELGRTAESLGRPARCRAIIFDAAGANLLLVGRTRPGREPYTVFPGGGLEEGDVTPTDGVTRELEEELGISPGQVILTGRAFVLEDDAFFLGYAAEDIQHFEVGGPEAHRDPAIYGTYTPGWLPLEGLRDANVVPHDIVTIIESART